MEVESLPTCSCPLVIELLLRSGKAPPHVVARPRDLSMWQMRSASLPTHVRML
jgi:hypothetical protein